MSDDNKQAHEVSNPVVAAPTAHYSSNSQLSQAAKSRRRSKKTFLVILGAVLILIVTAVVTYLLLQNLTAKPADKITKVWTLQTLGDDLKSSFTNKSGASILISKTSSPDTVIQKIAENSWTIFSSGSETLTVGSSYSKSSDNETDYNTVIKRLSTDGLSEVIPSGSTPSTYSSTNMRVRYFSSKDIICNLNNMPDNIKGGVDNSAISYNLRVDCTTAASFKDNSVSVKPFSDVYFNDKQHQGKDTLFGAPRTQTSATDGYKYATIGMSDLSGQNSLTGEFYQTPDSKWHFFTAAKEQDKISCADYNSSDLIDAYLGFTCWDTSSDKSAFVHKSDPTFKIVPGGSGG